MGGYGSGRGERFGGRRTTLAALGRLDVRRLQRQGYLDGAEHWLIVRQHGRLLLLVVTREDGRLAVEPWGRDRQRIPLDWTPCHYGGMRPWLRCPRCARRRAVLHIVGARVQCRHCARLPYASQHTTAEDRRYQKVRTIRDRLGASPNLAEPISPGTKPRGMHWRTWERLRAQEQQAHQVILDAMGARFVRRMSHN